MNMKMLRGLFIFLSVLLLSLFLSPKTQAATIKSGENVKVAKNQTISDTLFISGSVIKIDADVKGDIFCAGEKVQINGNVEGDVICAAQEIKINGKVNGSVRVAAESVIISGPVTRNVMVFAKDVTVRSNVDKEMFIGAQNLNFQGKIGQNLNGGVEKANITGSIKQNVNLEVDNLQIGKNAKIGGDLNYKSQNPASIVSPSGIIGKVNYEESLDEKDEEKIMGAAWIGGKVFSILSTLVIALLIVFLWPKAINKITEEMKNNLLGSFGFGLLAMIGIPIIAVLLIVTLIGIPLSILLLVFWGVALFLSRIFLGIFIGKKLLESFWKSKKDSIVWSSIVGVVVTWIAFSTPFIGGLLSFVAMGMGLGAIFYVLRPKREANLTPKKK